MHLPYQSPDQVLTALKASGAHTSLWLLCVADRHAAALPELLEACRAAGLRVCGGLFPGLIVGPQHINEGLLAIPLPDDSLVAIATLELHQLRWLTPLPPLPSAQDASSLILVDCLAPNISLMLEQLYDTYGNLLPHCGAGTGFHDLRNVPSVFTQDGFFPSAGLVVIQPRKLTVRVRHGWHRVRGPFVASRTRGSVIQDMNWEPAGPFYRRLVASQNPELADKPIFPDQNSNYPLCFSKEGSEDVMRDPMRITDDNEVVTLSEVPENSLLYLAHGDRHSLVAAARQAVEDCGMPQDVERCFVSNCFSRALMLKETFHEELEAVCAAISEFTAVRPEGVLALGEIAANGKQSLEFFNKTIVIALSHS